MRCACISLIAAMSLVATMLVAGCDDTADPGTVIVKWSIPISCTDAGIEDVVVHLKYAGQPHDYDLQRVGCDVKTLTFVRVAPGDYDVRVSGLDAEDAELYVGVQEGVKVAAGATVELSEPPITLSQKKGAVDITWDFESGLCGANKVEGIQIGLFDSSLNQMYEEDLMEPFPCDSSDSQVVGEDLGPSYTPAGILIGGLDADTYVVHVFGLDEAGNKTFKAKAEAEVERGEATRVQALLQPCGSEEVPDLQCN